jgi:disulfide bond formation protein DsbB
MVFGTVGLIFLNLWVSLVYLIYSIGFNFLLYPTKHCQYCYYAVKESTIDSKTGKTIKKLLPKEQWIESCLEKHVACGKKYGFNFFLIWLIPIVLIIVSFFFSFSIFAVIALIGFIIMLASMLTYTKKKICPTCVIVEECHSSF